MTTPAFFLDGKLQMRMQIRNGPWKIVPLARQEVNPALVFANEQQGIRAATYERLAEKVMDDADWCSTRQIFVTSPGHGDGKTSTAFNLAWALSTKAKPVLLAELNLRAPRLRAMLGKPRVRYGVDSVLRGIAAEKESVFSLVNEDLHVSAVRDPMKRSEVKRFQSSLEAFVEWANKEYQWVVFDCPPVLSGEWNQWFKERARSVMLVARSERTSGVDVRHASKRLGDHLKGVVLNNSSLTV